MVRKVSAATGIITTVAGTPGISGNMFAHTGDGGPATEAALYYPMSVAVDELGNLYISEFAGGSIRMVSAKTGIISTVAAGASGGITYDGAGNLYVGTATFGNSIEKINLSTQAIVTIAGTGTAGYSGDGGPAASATFRSPAGVALDSAGNIYVADTGNSVIRMINASSGVITTVAGTAETANYGGDGGPATSAEMNWPMSVAVDGTGNLYIAERGNNVVRKVNVGSASIGFAAQTNAGTTDLVEGAKSVTVTNIGNQPLSLDGAIQVPADFPLDAANTCTTTATLPAGGECILAVDFAPQATGALAETLTITENSEYGTPSQVVSLTGVGAGAAVAAAPEFSIPGGTYQAAQTVTFKDNTPNVVIYYTTEGARLQRAPQCMRRQWL